MKAREPLNQIEVAGAKKRFKSHSVPDSVWDDENVIVEKKLDGHRFKCFVGAQENRFDSRRESVHDGLYVEKTDNVPYLRDYPLPGFEGTVLDGEFVAGNDSGDVSHALAEGSTTQVAYHVFDILFYKGKDIREAQAQNRRALLEHMFKSEPFASCPSIFLVGQVKGTALEKRAVLDAELKAGREGVMLKDMTQPYGKGWTKVKRAATYDVVITGYDDPKPVSVKKGDVEATETKFFLSGWVGAIRFSQWKDGKLVDMGCCSGMDDATRQEFSENKEKYLGRVMEIEAQSRSVHGKFRHPRFLKLRDWDKDPKECIYRADEC